MVNDERAVVENNQPGGGPYFHDPDQDVHWDEDNANETRRKDAEDMRTTEPCPGCYPEAWRRAN